MAMKKFAFYWEDDHWKTIGAEELEKRRKYDPHTWKDEREYFSAASDPERRLKMHLKRTGDSVYFAFNPGQDEGLKRLGIGEGLGHYLYKIAISELKRATIKLRGKGVDFEIDVTHSEVEKSIQLEGRRYFIDVLIHFTSKSAYKERWSGCLGIEVHDSNSVGEIKRADLRALNIPLVEIDVYKNYLWCLRGGEQSVTPEDIRNQIEWLKKRFVEELWVNVVSDPKSDEFLKNENIRLNKTLQEKEVLVKSYQRDLKDKSQSLRNKDSELRYVNSKLKEEQEYSNELARRLTDAKDRIEHIGSMGLFRFLKYKLTGV